MKLGVIGGLGPMATAYFMELVIKMTEAKSDHEHLDMIIFNYPSIPDRTNYILGKDRANPIPPMIKIGKQLAKLGVDYISIPCITAHHFYDILTKSVRVPIIDVVKETVALLKANGIAKVGITATDGTIKGNFFQDELARREIDFVLPAYESQKDIMDLIYGNIKAGKTVEMDKFFNVSNELRRKGAEIIILGCTELSLIKRDYIIGAGYLDTMEVLAKASIMSCGKSLKDEYMNIITRQGEKYAI